MLTRTGDAAQASRLMTALQATNGRLRADQTAVASGKSAQTFAEIADQAGLLLRTKEQRGATGSFIAQNKQVSSRLQAMDGALAQLGDIAERMRALMVQRLDASTGNLVPLEGELNSAMAEAAAQLNIKLGDRYLFAGSRTDQPPVALPDGGIASADPGLYYQGDDVRLTFRAQPGTEIEYGVTASDPVFANFFAALGQAKAANASGERSGLEAAAGLLESSLNGLAELRGELGATAARLDAVTQSQESSLAYLDDIVTGIEDTDLPSTLTRIAQNQASLEAAYLTASRLSQLSLADYLR